MYSRFSVCLFVTFMKFDKQNFEEYTKKFQTENKYFIYYRYEIVIKACFNFVDK